MRVAITLALATTGCVELLDLPEDARVAPSGPWRCQEEPFDSVLGARAAQSDPTAIVRVRACDFVTGCARAVTGLAASLCNKRDVGCTNPILDGLRDVDGVLTVPVPVSGSGFDGYLKVDAPLALCTDDSAFPGTAGALCQLAPGCDTTLPDDRCRVPTYAPALLFFNPPITGDLEAALPLQLLPSADLPAVVQAAGAELDPSTGNLFITALDCDGEPAAGVTYAIAEHRDEVTALYVDSGVVSNTVLETDESGIGGFVGVPPGFVEITGFAPDLTPIGEIGLQSAPFTLTYSFMTPTR